MEAFKIYYMNLPQVAEIKISYHPTKADKPIIRSSVDAFNFFKGFYMGETICLQEQFAAMYLNRANKVLGVTILSIGGITGTVVDIRLTICIALKCAATSILLCHNHPSGNLQPSKSDIDLTERIKQAAELFDIRLADHLIITSDACYSFADEGLL
jgi:DNA repair protein RadC